jgi:hypothetical protein
VPAKTKRAASMSNRPMRRRSPSGLTAAGRAVAAGDVENNGRHDIGRDLDMTEDEVDALRSSVRWPAFLATVPTVTKECRVEHGWVYQHGQFDRIAAPTLLLAGSESPPELSEATQLAAAAIPGAQIRVLHGHGHFAHETDSAIVATIVRQFISYGSLQRRLSPRLTDPLARHDSVSPAQRLASPSPGAKLGAIRGGLPRFCMDGGGHGGFPFLRVWTAADIPGRRLEIYGSGGWVFESPRARQRVPL